MSQSVGVQFDINILCSDLSGEGGDGEPLPRPGHQGGGAGGEGRGLDVTLGHVAQQAQLQLLRLGQQGLKYW